METIDHWYLEYKQPAIRPDTAPKNGMLYEIK